MLLAAAACAAVSALPVSRFNKPLNTHQLDKVGSRAGSRIASRRSCSGRCGPHAGQGQLTAARTCDLFAPLGHWGSERPRGGAWVQS